MRPGPHAAPLLSLSALALCAATTLAHETDPLVRDRLQRVELARGGSGGGSAGLSVSTDYLNFPAQGVQLLSWLTLRDFGDRHQNGNSCSGYASPAGREYAILGTYQSTCFVEITDPGDPRIVAVINGPSSLWRDMKVHQDKVYSVSEGGWGIQVIDVAQIDAGIVTLLGAVTSGGLESTHTLAVNNQSGFLYRAGGGQNGLRIYSLADPANPVFVGAWNDRYVHEAQVVTMASGPWAGREIAFACSGLNSGWSSPALDILDVTNKQSIQLLRRFVYSGAVYSHQGWLTEDQRIFYLNDELDETGSNPMRTRVIDVSSLTNPVERPSFSTGSTAVDHNLYVRGNLLFEANYRSGLHVFDVSDPLQPVRTAWFDTWPEDEAANFNSLWNNWPFLPSGTVIGSDIEKGLFVWRLGDPELSFQFPGGVPLLVDPAGELVPLTISDSQPGQLVPGSARLRYDLGGGWVEAPLIELGGGQFLVPFPASACGANVAWHLTAHAATGRTWSFPQGAPVIVRHSLAASANNLLIYERMDATAGWTVGAPGDTATAGLWLRGDPIGTTAQPEDDHSLLGSDCWFTGQGLRGQGAGAADVDGGATTLLSAVYDLSAAAEPVISYWRWFATHVGPGPLFEDVFAVDVSNDGGASWVPVERVGPGGRGTSGGWFLHQFRLREFVTPSAQVRLRFVASDFGNPSTVEAAIDDLVIADVTCPPADPQPYCTAKLSSQGCLPRVASTGAPSASSPAPFEIRAESVLSNKAGLMIYGRAQASIPFQGGTLCVATSIRRTPVSNSGGNLPPVDCSGVLRFDFNAWLRTGSDPSLAPGASVDAQFWYRDPGDPAGFGSGLSDALHFTLRP